MDTFENISQPRQTEKAYRCPCCGYKTLHSRGEFDLCPVCFWEDDGQDDHDAAKVRGGPNGTLSLSDARQAFKIHGAVEVKFLKNVRAPFADEV